MSPSRVRRMGVDCGGGVCRDGLPRVALIGQGARYAGRVGCGLTNTAQRLRKAGVPITDAANKSVGEKE